MPRVVTLSQHLALTRCPHCRIDEPSLSKKWKEATQSSDGRIKNQWAAYACKRCGGVITAYAEDEEKPVRNVFPSPEEAHHDIPEPARDFLQQAMDSIHAPSGSIMLSASAVDAMLKENDYKEGSLHSRINKARDDGLLTSEMAKWAHQVRLDANVQRHADESVGLPTTEDAKHTLSFAEALGAFLFVIPAQVERGLKETSPE